MKRADARLLITFLSSLFSHVVFVLVLPISSVALRLLFSLFLGRPVCVALGIIVVVLIFIIR